jgi:hypothetical protein
MGTKGIQYHCPFLGDEVISYQRDKKTVIEFEQDEGDKIQNALFNAASLLDNHNNSDSDDERDAEFLRRLAYLL